MNWTTDPTDFVQEPSPRMVPGPFIVPHSRSMASLVETIRRRTLPLISDPTNQRYQDSFGQKLSDLGDRMRWDLAGTALQEWNETLLPLLHNIVGNNKKEIYKDENIADPLIIHVCYMLGCDRAHAHPTIILACDEQRLKPLLRRTVKVIQRANEFADKGFKLQPALISDLELKANLAACHARITNLMGDQATGPGPVSLCGRQILIDENERLATIGGTIIIDGSCYGLTVAHPFMETSYPTIPTRRSPKVELLTMDWALGSDDESGDEDSAHDSGHGSVQSEYENARDPSPEPADPVMSDRGAENVDRSRLIQVARYNLPMDWATMHLDDHRYFAANEVFLPAEDSTGQDKWVYLEKDKSTFPLGDTIIVDQKSVLNAGCVSAMGTGTLRNAGSEAILWVVHCHTPLPKGICGSWVLDSQTYEILGPVIAGSEALGEIFIVPIKDILESVREEHLASEVRFPTKTDSLWLAVYFGNTAVATRLLRAFDKLPEHIPQAPVRDPIFSPIHADGMTMLHWSAWKGYQKILEKLCEIGGDINGKTRAQKTPLHLACFLSPEEASSLELKRRKECTVEFLLSQEGIDINATDEEGNTPLMIAKETGFKYAKELFENQTFMRQDSSFFTPGRMFATHFVDPFAEAFPDKYTADTIPDGLVERGYSRIRQFIVVKEERGFCYACPVSTYGGCGTAREDIASRAHAIVYTMGSHPTYVNGERQLSIPPVPVVPSNDGVRLELASRINFAVYFPIYHDCKVKNLGMVHKDYIPLLAQYARQESGW